jgi:hypothetical protein
MERKFIDIITTTYITKRMKAEAELEKLINSDPFVESNSIDVFIDEITLRVNRLREINADAQTWENIVSQITNKTVPEKE